MWMRPIPSDECVRACEWVSLRLDAQLSDFESLLLDAHLAQCETCRAFAEEASAFTEALRGTPQEEPFLALEFPRRRSARHLALRVVSVSAIAAVFGLSGLIGLELADRSSPGTAARFDRDVLGLKDRQLEVLDNPGHREVRAIVRGLAGAEEVTLGSGAATGARSTGRPATGTNALQTTIPRD